MDIDQVKPFKSYFVIRNVDGKREVCYFNDGSWYTDENNEFFALHDYVFVEGHAYECDICGEWALYSSSVGCENCFKYTGKRNYIGKRKEANAGLRSLVVIYLFFALLMLMLGIILVFV